MNRMIPIAKPLLGKEELAAVKEVFKSGILVQGEKTKLFESEFAEYVGVKHAIAVSNGTTALDVSLKALGISHSDEAITPAFSFVASSNCILYQGAKPVFADIDPKTFNIDPSDVERKITKKTKAIVCAHLFGQPAAMRELRETAEKHNIALVEDAAQSHGAEYDGKKVGGIGDVGCFSFYATKNMTTGEGGMITTNDGELAAKIRLLINHGQTGKYHHVSLGYNYRMTEISAAIGRVQLRKLEGFNKKRRENAQILTDGIRKIRGLTPPHVAKKVKHVFYQYVIRVENKFPLNRDTLAKHLQKAGVGVDVHYPIPIYKQPLYQELGYQKMICPATEDACRRILSLPVHPALTTRNLAYIINALRKAA
jgi:perosamine synthetase